MNNYITIAKKYFDKFIIYFYIFIVLFGLYHLLNLVNSFDVSSSKGFVYMNIFIFTTFMVLTFIAIFNTGQKIKNLNN